MFLRIGSRSPQEWDFPLYNVGSRDLHYSTGGAEVGHDHGPTSPPQITSPRKRHLDSVMGCPLEGRLKC
jgi:hypothetical protein